MSLSFRPHTITVQPATEPVDGSTLAVSVPALGTAATVTGHIVTKTPGEVFQSHGVLLESPVEFLHEIADSGSFRPGYRVSYGTRRFSVKTRPRIYDADSDHVTDHASIIMDEEDTAE